MKRVVYKWTECYVTVPTDDPESLWDVGPFHVGTQRDRITVWAEVNPEAQEHRDFELLIRGTGEVWDDQDGSRYLGTIPSDDLVWHVYLRRLPKTQSDNEQDKDAVVAD